MDDTDELRAACPYASYSSRVQAVVTSSGPTDLARHQKTAAGTVVSKPVHEYTEDLVGGTPEEKPELYAAASPLTYVTADDPPVLILHEEGGVIVPTEQADMLDAKLREVGVPHTYWHISFGHDPAWSQIAYQIVDGEIQDYGTVTVYDVTFEFFDKYLK